MIKYVLAALLFSGSAFAAESEFFFQADEGQKFLSFFGSYRMASVGSTDTDGFLVGTEYEQGINEMLSWHVGLDYATYTTDTGSSETDTAGLSDLMFGLKGRHMVGPGSLRFGAAGYLGFQDAEVDNGDSNRATGGIAIAPYIGYQMDMDPCIFGLKLSREVLLADGTKDNEGTEQTISGGEETVITAYYEHLMGDANRVGASLSHMSEEDNETESGGTTTTSAGEDGLTTLTVYGRMDRDSGTWIPSVDYVLSSDQYDDYDDLAVSLKYRMSL